MTLKEIKNLTKDGRIYTGVSQFVTNTNNIKPDYVEYCLDEDKFTYTWFQANGSAHGGPGSGKYVQDIHVFLSDMYDYETVSTMVDILKKKAKKQREKFLTEQRKKQIEWDKIHNKPEIKQKTENLIEGRRYFVKNYGPKQWTSPVFFHSQIGDCFLFQELVTEGHQQYKDGKFIQPHCGLLTPIEVFNHIFDE